MKKFILLVIVMLVLSLGLSCTPTVAPQPTSTQPTDKPYFTDEEVSVLLYNHICSYFAPSNSLDPVYTFDRSGAIVQYMGNQKWEFSITAKVEKKTKFSFDPEPLVSIKSITATYYARTGIIEIK